MNEAQSRPFAEICSMRDQHPDRKTQGYSLTEFGYYANERFDSPDLDSLLYTMLRRLVFNTGDGMRRAARLRDEIDKLIQERGRSMLGSPR